MLVYVVAAHIALAVMLILTAWALGRVINRRLRRHKALYRYRVAEIKALAAAADENKEEEEEDKENRQARSNRGLSPVTRSRGKQQQQQQHEQKDYGRRGGHAYKVSKDFSDELGDDIDFAPFVRQGDAMSFRMALRFAVGFVVLAPFRLILFFMTLLTASIMVWFVLLGHKKGEMISQSRRKLVVFILSNGARVCLFALGFMHIRLRKFSDPGASHGGAPIVVSNHVSYVDALFLVWKYCPSFVSKASIAKMPLIGCLGKSLDTIFVDRSREGGDGASLRIQKRCVKWAEAKDEACTPVAIFPEGTTTNGTQVLKFRTGAFVPGTPVHMCALNYAQRDFSPAWGSEALNLMLHLLCLVSQPSNLLTASVLPVYTPTALEKNNPARYAAKAQKMIAIALQQPVSEHTYKDKVGFMSVLNSVSTRQLKEAARLSAKEAAGSSAKGLGAVKKLQ